MIQIALDNLDDDWNALKGHKDVISRIKILQISELIKGLKNGSTNDRQALINELNDLATIFNGYDAIRLDRLRTWANIASE